MNRLCNSKGLVIRPVCGTTAWIPILPSSSCYNIDMTSKNSYVEIINFLDNYYQKALQLSADFGITRDFDWTPLLILNELSVQVGHIYNIAYRNPSIDEPKRTFDNMGDELSDVFLQLITLADSLHLDLYHIKDLPSIAEDSWFALPVLLGQLNEAVMEKCGYRFSKPRVGFNTTDQFIEDRILRLFVVSYRIAQKYQLSIDHEFQMMLDDANNFLERFRSQHS